MKRPYQSVIPVVLLCILLALALPAAADSQVRIVRLSSLQGDVNIDRQAGQGREKAILNMPATQGMSLITGSDGRAEVEFEDGTVIQAAPESELSFQQLSLRSSGDKVSSIEVRRGTAYFNVRHKGDDEFHIVLAGRDLPVSKTARFRVIVDDQQLRLAVFKGDVSFAENGEQVKVRKGEELTLNRADGSYASSSLIPGEFDVWAKERTDYHDRYYSASSYKSYPYYGRGDLGFFGGWYNIPGYGSIWRPNNAGLDWDPFGYGYWSWCPGSGYMWVSAYPWGWLPYRYGTWAYVSGWGWGWLPYGNWNSWRPSPGVIHTPPDYHRPQPPSVNTPSHPTIPVARPPRSPFRPPRGPVMEHPAEGEITAVPRPAPPSRLVLPPARPSRLERQDNGFVPPPFARGTAGQERNGPRPEMEPRPGSPRRDVPRQSAASGLNGEPRPDARPRQGFEPRHSPDQPGRPDAGPRHDMGPRPSFEPRHSPEAPTYSRPQPSAPEPRSMPSMPSGSRSEPAAERGQGRNPR
jgi:hypothetical protein